MSPMNHGCLPMMVIVVVVVHVVILLFFMLVVAESEAVVGIVILSRCCLVKSRQHHLRGRGRFPRTCGDAPVACSTIPWHEHHVPTSRRRAVNVGSLALRRVPLGHFLLVLEHQVVSRPFGNHTHVSVTFEIGAELLQSAAVAPT